MDLAVPVYIYIQLTFLQIYLANTNRFPFNVINWAGETLNLKKWNKCKCFLLSKISLPTSVNFFIPYIQNQETMKREEGLACYYNTRIFDNHTDRCPHYSEAAH